MDRNGEISALEGKFNLVSLPSPHGERAKSKRRMNMFNQTDSLAFVEDQKRKLLREAKLHQLARQAEQDRIYAGDRLMRLIGDLMIVGGMKLKARAKTTTPSVDPIYTPN